MSKRVFAHFDKETHVVTVLPQEIEARLALADQLAEAVLKFADRFESVCPDADLHVDPADAKRLRDIRALARKVKSQDGTK